MDLSKLKLKPVVKPHEQVPITIKQEPIIIKGITLTDARATNKETIDDIELLRENLKKNKMVKVSVKMPTDATDTDVEQAKETTKTLEALKETIIIEPPKKKAKKVQNKLLIIQEEESEDKNQGKIEGKEIVPLEKVEKLDKGKKERKTPKIQKGVSELGAEEWVEIGNLNRLPVRPPQINIKVSSYYMNNRKIFVNFINSLFEPYKKEVEDVTKAISCDSIGQDNENFSLLTHQKLVRDYMNLYTPYRGLLLYHGLGAGKCMKKGTTIMMSDGSIQLIENIKVGDLLMGDDSKPRTVLSLARGTDKMYDIIPVKGDKYTVNQEHILCLKASGFPKICNNNHKANYNYNIQWVENNRFESKTFTYNPKSNETKILAKENAYNFFEKIINDNRTKNNVIEIAVKDYLKISKKKKSFLKGYKVPIDFPENELPMDPYMIGYWLGNEKYYNNQLLNTLKDLNMIGNKHIPMLYKCNSRENRLKLLAGLIDSDGHLHKNGGFEFTNTNEILIDDVIFLARSLGFACYKHIKNTSLTYEGIKKNGTAFRIQINGQGIEEIPTNIAKKRAKPRTQIKDVLVTSIQVKYVNEDEYYGFMLDDNCRYLMGDFTVTHNTCTSIALAEGMKTGKRVIIMTPASLRRNYLEELKKCGDALYKKNQYWEWIDKSEAFETLSSVLSLPVEYIKRKQGAWLVNVKKKTNYAELSGSQKKSLDDQLDEMIQSKYIFINYNGLRDAKLKDMTGNYEKNLFDNAIIIIDEAHNFISKIVNKLKKEREIKVNSRGEKDHLPRALSLKLYEYLMSAKNARVVLLTGTPIINYPNEIAILFNILRGYIKTWEIPLEINTSKKITSETLQEALEGEKVLDFLDYSASSKKLFITRNPLGFKNKIKDRTGYAGVSGEKKIKESGKNLTVLDNDFVSDDDFERRVISILRRIDIDVNTAGIKIHNYKALPDKFEDFIARFIESDGRNIKNKDSFKRRIIGLTSYFRSAQEGLLPRYEKTPEYHHVIKVPMSDYQFKIYEGARKEERKQEKSSKKKQGEFDKDGIYKDPSSTYRIFSRAFCNFVMPTPPGRPMPRETKEDVDFEELTDMLKKKDDNAQDVNVEDEGEVEGDAMLNALGDTGYQARLDSAINDVKEHSDEYLSPEGLATYSPKFLHMLENIQDPGFSGLHLVYSQFRTLEGIGLFAMTLEQNGFTRFKLKKSSSGVWEMDIDEEDQGKPTFALYTGTETSEEKEIIRNIYNGSWDYIPTNLASQLKEIANNNNMGEIIKVLMITSSGSEGINLRNTRHVHIMEPYWHPVRTEQVIGRARRICSHKDLPLSLQTVEVFIYLMTFTEKQAKSDESIELKLKDLSKRDPKVPLTSDEALYEISSIKEELNSQLIRALKETSIDCAVYSKGNKEGLQCISFGEPDNKSFAYNPSIDQDQIDTVAIINKQKIAWTAKSVKIYGVEYAARKMKENLYNVYDLASYRKVEEMGEGDPILVGTLEIKDNGKKVFNTLIS